MSGTITQFTPGDIVISETGDVGGATGIGDNQASPIELVEIDPSLPVGSDVVGTLVLPAAVSGEFGSSSEGTLELAANGQSLVIAGYDVNYATYNAGETNGNNVYGNAAEAQSYSVEPAGGSYTLVPRAIVDISGNGTVDDSTNLLGVFNTNNPRSVATVDGTSFYVAGQGVKGDTTQGVFLATDGASTATAINTGTDARTAELSNVTGTETLYVSQDSKQPSSGGTSDIASFSTAEPTGTSTETALPGISKSVTLSGTNGNGVNGSSGTVNLSPENFFFANATTLYVADGGAPKQGGLGDGGLQKWSLVGGTWKLDYTLSTGLDGTTGLVSNASGATSTGDTGLIGLTGSVNAATGAVALYATTVPLNDLGDTGLYTITDTLADTTAAQASGEAFSELLAGTAGMINIRGVALAPSPACFCRGTRIRTARGEVAVEDLAIGDEVVTVSGALEPIRWVGRRAYRGRFLRQAVRPIRIAAGALASGVPSRDLRVSPCHAMLIDGLLIPAAQLLNGRSVTVDMGCDGVEYFHVELPRHDALWAEAAASESFVDDDNRMLFHNAADHAARYPDEQATPASYCAPRVESGHELEAIRNRLDGRAWLAA